MNRSASSMPSRRVTAMERALPALTIATTSVTPAARTRSRVVSAAEPSVYEELTARQRRHDAEHGFCLWTMVGPEDEVLGFTGAQPWPHAWGPTGQIEIGWRLGRAHWGKGYVTAAALTTLERVRAAGVTDVVAMVNAGNARSIAVTKRLGMELAERFTLPSSRQEGHRYRLAL